MPVQDGIREKTAATGSRAFYLRISRRSVAIAAAILIAPWVFIFAMGANLFHHHAEGMDARVSATASRPTAAPWGDLEVVPITLEPPADFAARFLVYDSSSWYFRNCDRDKLPAILRSVDFPENLVADVMEHATPHPSISGMVVKPDHPIIYGLSDDQRQKLYELLASEPANYSKTDPFRFRGDAVEQWLENSGLSDETIRLVRRMIYRRGDIAIFSDVSAVVESLSMESEKVSLFRALARQSALHVTLRVTPQSDLSAIVQYWGRGGRAHEIRPILKSLAKVPGGSSIGITELLPPFARTRVHQYPAASGSSPNSRQDCHWTSMNFWSEFPDDGFTDPAYVARKLAAEYQTVSGEHQFGDVLFLTRNGDQAIHSAVYLASDIVFTKNGGTITSPWMLMKMSNLLAYYSMHGPVEVRAYRKNGI